MNIKVKFEEEKRALVLFPTKYMDRRFSWKTQSMLYHTRAEGKDGIKTDNI